MKSLDPALSTWPDWGLALDHKPHVIKPLLGGETNKSYLLESSLNNRTIKLVLRINSPHAKILGINRQREKTILEIVSKAGFSPEIYFNNLQILVYKYIEGDTLDKKVITKRQVEDYKKLLDDIHSTKINLPPFSYIDHLQHYWQELQKSGKTTSQQEKNYHQQILEITKSLEAKYPDRQLCHHDAGFYNVIATDYGLKLIDWEYAALGLKQFDQLVSGQYQVEADCLVIANYINQLWYKLQEKVSL